MVQVLVAGVLGLFGVLQLPAGLWPFLLVPIWLVWEIPAAVRQFRSTRNLQREWEELVNS